MPESSDSTRGVAEPITSGFPGANVQGFDTLPKAVEYMLSFGCETFHFLSGPTDGSKSASKLHGGKASYYAVANGREVGQYSDYGLEVRPRVFRYGSAAHKGFATRDAAEAYIEARKNTRLRIRDTLGLSIDSHAAGGGDCNTDLETLVDTLAVCYLGK